jgi:AcrR family transcriptional regulator
MSEKVTKREVIKTEALRLFAERGVDAVSVNDIALACGMSKPNLYAHFKGREDLVRELFEEGYKEYGQRMTEAVAAAAPFRVRLESLVRLICVLHDQDRLRFRFLLMTHHAHLRHVVLGERNPVEIVVRLVASAMAAGEIPTRNVELVAAAIVGMVVQPATFLMYGRIGDNLSPVADEIVSMCMRVVT